MPEPMDYPVTHPAEGKATDLWLKVFNEDKPPVASPLWGYEGSQAMKVLGLPALRCIADF